MGRLPKYEILDNDLDYLNEMGRKEWVAGCKEYTIENWIKWSKSPYTTLEDIKKIIFITRDPNALCWSYLCEFFTLTPENFDEFVALSTGRVFTPTNYKRKVKKICKMVKDGTIRSRIDWFAILKYQSLPVEVIDPYIKVDGYISDTSAMELRL